MKFIQAFPIKPRGYGCCIATPDGGFLYTGNRTVNFVKPDEDLLIKIFNTKQQVTGIDIDPLWNTEEKFFAILTDDKSILIWDFNKGIAISGHKAHCHAHLEGVEKTNSFVHISFLKNRNLLSLDSNNLVVYCVASNSICVRPKFAPGKGQTLTALKCSPYKESIFALGTNRGQIYVCDLQKMAVIFMLGRHQAPVISLSWNLIELTSDTPKKSETTKPPLLSSRAVEENDDIFNIYDYNYVENEFGAPTKIENSEEVEEECKTNNEHALNPNFDFQEACENLKQDINAINNNVEGISDILDIAVDGGDAVTLDDCLDSKMAVCLSSMGESHDSTENSIELAERSTSSSRHVDERKAETERETVDHECEDNLKKTEIDSTDVENEKNDILLVSASNDCQIWIWNSKTGGCCDNLKSQTRKNVKSTKMPKALQIMWRNSSELYIMDTQGQIIKWMLSPNISSLSSNSKRSYKFKKISDNFNGIKALEFGISKHTPFLWYVSTELELICENIDSAERILQYTTAPRGIMTARECPENNSKIALGFPDCRIGLLDTSQLSSNKAVIHYIHETPRLQSFAKSLAWSSDGLKIAYGSNGGHVGYVNIETQKHTKFHTIYGRPVFSVVWRGAEEIFAICKNKLFAYNIGHLEPITISGINGIFSEVSVHENHLFLGNTYGYIEIYAEEKLQPTENSRILTFKRIQTVEVAKNYITEISWNPLKPNEFGVVSDEAYINILSLDANTSTVAHVRRVEFGQPKAVVSTIKWSNRDSNKIITSGFDGSLRIFDLNRPKNDELIFEKQFNCPLFRAMLLPRDERYAICTGDAITVNIVDTNFSDDTTKIQTRKKFGTLNSIKWATKMNIGCTTIANKKKENTKLKNTAAKSECAAIPAETARELTDKIVEPALDKLEMQPITEKAASTTAAAAAASEFMKIPPTLMSLIAREHNKNPLENLYRILNQKFSKGPEKEAPILIAQLFGNKRDAEKVLNDEFEIIKTQTTLEKLGSVIMSQVKGDVKSVILDAIQKRQLGEWHIALSPTVSFSFWQKCCNAFAEQLLEQGYALQAATYFVALHNPREAINMLMTANYFKEALLIGRIYLPESDPLIDETINKWIDDLENHGNLPGAALICTAAHQYMRGYEILSKQRVLGPEETCIIKQLKELGSIPI